MEKAVVTRLAFEAKIRKAISEKTDKQLTQLTHLAGSQYTNRVDAGILLDVMNNQEMLSLIMATW